jgi:hypothetical protein
MGFADPQSVTVAGSAKSLPRVGAPASSDGAFKSADGKFTLTIKHSEGPRNRHVVQLRYDDLTANPLVPSQNSAVSTWTHIVVDAPRNGLTADQVTDISDAIIAWATPANLNKLVGFEV